MKGLNLEELWLRGNTLCDSFPDQSTYVRSVWDHPVILHNDLYPWGPKLFLTVPVCQRLQSWSSGRIKGSAFSFLCPFSSVQSLSCVRLFATPWTAARQASLSITNSQSLLKLMSIESVMQSNHLILCHPLLLLPSIFPSIRDFSNESALRIRWPKHWSFSFSISPSNEYSGLL